LQPFSPADRPTGNVIRYVSVDALDRNDFKPGIVSAPAGRATVAYVQAALDLARGGAVSAIIGCPHNETAVNAAGISFSGYPSLLARLTGTPDERVFMMLVGGGLRILHATLHERLQHALGRLSVELVETAGKECASALRSLGIEKPTIGVFGINPHAGENGLFGDDDDRITVPAVARLRSAGLKVEGPVGADLMLGRKDIDGFVAIYHDQGHIPVKLVAGRRASALTVGTGVLFSSVGHGSAFDIAGKGKADPEGILRTIDLLSRPTGSKQAVTDS
jgi:4-hydroxythreonine-4-phosphate dehydrogenase